MMLYHCIGDLGPLQECILRCLAIERDAKPHIDKDNAMIRHRFLLERYKIWRKSSDEGYNRQMLLLETDLCVFLYDTLKGALTASDVPADARTVLACDVRKEQQEYFPPSHGERTLISDESSLRLVPLRLDLGQTLLRVYAQQRNIAKVAATLRTAGLEAELLGIDIADHLKYPMYDSLANGSGV